MVAMLPLRSIFSKATTLSSIILALGKRRSISSFRSNGHISVRCESLL
jgi:hypothetical protein